MVTLEKQQDQRQEIERKFFVKKLPDLSQKEPVRYERYFLYRTPPAEIRIQKKGDIYEFERKIEISPLTRVEHTFEITREEFNELKTYAKDVIVRDSYIISSNPEISVKIYHGAYEGLIRAEVEFSSETEAQNFKPPEWFGKEITNTKLARDASLIDLNAEEFKQQLHTFLAE